MRFPRGQQFSMVLITGKQRHIRYKEIIDHIIVVVHVKVQSYETVAISIFSS